MELVKGGLGNRVVIKALYWLLKLFTSLVFPSLLYCRLVTDELITEVSRLLELVAVIAAHAAEL